MQFKVGMDLVWVQSGVPTCSPFIYLGLNFRSRPSLFIQWARNSGTRPYCGNLKTGWADFQPVCSTGLAVTFETDPSGPDP